jgi:hypothetical protein
VGNDKRPARELLPKVRDAIHPDLLYADAGYDAEWIHEFCNEQWGLYSVIKPVRHRGPQRARYESRSRQ